MSLMSILVGTLVSAWGAWSVGAWPCPLEVMQDRAGSLELGEMVNNVGMNRWGEETSRILALVKRLQNRKLGEATVFEVL